MDKGKPRIKIEDLPQSASRELKEEELRKVKGGVLIGGIAQLPKAPLMDYKTYVKIS